MDNKKRYVQSDYIIPLQRQYIQQEQNETNGFQKFQEFEDDMQFYDFSSLKLKEDHLKRPLWVVPDCHIFLETFSKLYSQAHEFLVAIAEPVSRPACIHEYKITQYSLYAAMVLQYKPETIKSILNKLSKNDKLPLEVTYFINRNTKKFGSAKLFLRENSYYLQIFEKDLIRQILKQNQLQLEKVERTEENEYLFKSLQNKANMELEIVGQKIEQILNEGTLEKAIFYCEQLQGEGNDDDEQQKEFEIFRILGEHYEVSRAFILQNIPLSEEFEYQLIDDANPNLEIELRPQTKIRHYQEKALSKVFIGSKARSGVVVLPCGAGKTLLGIAAATHIKKRTIVFCDKTFAIQQWKQQFINFTTVSSKRIICFDSKMKTKEEYERFKNLENQGFILITNYSMVSKKKRENARTEETKLKQIMLEKMTKLEWGICILDEVQVVPAKTFQRVLINMKAHFKLGLTATLIREDNKIEDLNYMIGPKLYEENWLDLVNQNYLASPYCVEIRCKMPPEYMEAIENEKKDQVRVMIYSGNPQKFLALQYLKKKHEERGDKILVFSDKPFILKEYAQRLQCPCLTGEVDHTERVIVLDHFRRTRKINTVFISRIGDTAIDLPEATVVIQLSGFYGSRKQQVQRLGRIMRPKENDMGQFNAFFYNLVSLESDESGFAEKRQKFLIDQGFSFEIITELPYEQNIQVQQKMMMSDKNSQKEWLDKLLFESKKHEMVRDEVAKESSDDEDSSEDFSRKNLENPLNLNQGVYAEMQMKRR